MVPTALAWCFHNTSGKRWAARGNTLLPLPHLLTPYLPPPFPSLSSAIRLRSRCVRSARRTAPTLPSMETEEGWGGRGSILPTENTLCCTTGRTLEPVWFLRKPWTWGSGGESVCVGDAEGRKRLINNLLFVCFLSLVWDEDRRSEQKHYNVYMIDKSVFTFNFPLFFQFFIPNKRMCTIDSPFLWDSNADFGRCCDESDCPSCVVLFFIWVNITTFPAVQLRFAGWSLIIQTSMRRAPPGGSRWRKARNLETCAHPQFLRENPLFKTLYWV